MAETAAYSTGRIFVNYRREETAYPAGWLYDRLTGHYGRDQVFKDVDSIELGDDFVERITRAVGSCDVLLALIGKDWLSVADAKGRRRLDDEDDFVRLEIEAALTRDVRVIPILVDGASMPRADELPASLAGLARRQALELSPAQFDFDTSRLLRVLDRTLAQMRAEPDNAAPPSPEGGAPPSPAAIASPAGSAAEVPAAPGPRPEGKDERLPKPGVQPVTPPIPVPARLPSNNHVPGEHNRLRKRWRNVAAGAGIVMLAIAAMLAYSRLTSSPSSVEGSWQSIDPADGSRQTVTITTSGTGYAAQYRDESAGVCNGEPLDLRGSGNISASTLTMTYEGECPGGQPQSATIDYHYDLDSDTLTDEYGATWKRD